MLTLSNKDAASTSVSRSSMQFLSLETETFSETFKPFLILLDTHDHNTLCHSLFQCSYCWKRPSENREFHLVHTTQQQNHLVMVLCFRLHNGYILHFWKIKMLTWFHLKFLKVFHDITWETAWISVQVMHSWIRKIVSHVFCHKFNNFPLLKAWKITKKVDMTSMKLPSNFNCFIWYHMLINSHTCKLEAA